MARVIVAQDPFGVAGRKKRVAAYLVLISTARQVTCEELLELVETTGKYGAKVHITLESWQILVEVADGYDQRVCEAIWHLGHYCVSFLEKIDRIPTFVLTEDGNNGRRRLRWVRELGLRLNI